MGPGNRPLGLDWLEDFLALADSGNFSRAAEARAIAQPAFSRHIRALEEWVGVDLFDRSAHPAALTPAGQRFQPLLQKLLIDLEAARLQARAAQELGRGEPAVRRHACLVADVFSALVVGPRSDAAARADPDHVRQLARL